MKPVASYSDVVKAYASYRASPEGGGYDTLVVTVDQLYNQFNYGETSSVGIYEFVKFMVNNGSPRYLFLIGKGRDVYSHRSIALSTSQLKDLVPTAGAPGSDMAFSAGLNGTTYEPAVPTGRFVVGGVETIHVRLVVESLEAVDDITTVSGRGGEDGELLVDLVEHRLGDIENVLVWRA